MFTENHVSTISARYLPFAREIADATVPTDIRQRSWGSAVLAATYRALCNACTLKANKSAILGCPLFLQLWSWERFSIGRPSISDQPFGLWEIFDADNIDKPTFPIVYTRYKVRQMLYFNISHVPYYTLKYQYKINVCFMQRRFAHEQTKACYVAFNEQFDVYTSVIWEPYTEEVIQRRYPGGISDMCTRDQAYWMTKSKIIFDVFVEEMSQQRIMRQFGLRQLVVPPQIEHHIPEMYHRYV